MGSKLELVIQLGEFVERLANPVRVLLDEVAPSFVFGLW
jgi:hypothetical protein